MGPMGLQLRPLLSIRRHEAALLAVLCLLQGVAPECELVRDKQGGGIMLSVGSSL